MSNDQDRKPTFIKRLWGWFWGPAGAISLGVLLVGGFIAGIVFWGGFHTAMEMTNNEEFCISCHEMGDNVYVEYAGTVHDQNASGVRATCPDCHVPHEWQHKVVRKIQATRELWHTALGTIDTPEKFESKRLELAQNVWRAMKETDSRECRNCHDFDAMDVTLQSKRARENHLRATDEGLTCIDCHKGIAHELPKGAYGINPELVYRHANPKPDAKPEG
ncbi:NapC/NirT family cytochrome c [Caenispirillum salinarum]|uniref:NapC/NirT family cytochrome c n=1 Tax=Caenispirillum salinarum TaxID=859058 RepID=UPI00384F3806